MMSEKSEELRERILELVAEYSAAAFPAKTFVKGQSPVPVSGRVFDAADLQSLVDSSNVYSNHMVAFVRAMSGQASEKAPQTNQTVRQFAFGYRLILDNVPATHHYFDPVSTNFTDPNIAGMTNEIVLRSNTWVLAKNYETNLHDLRLTFRWPLLPGGSVGSGRQVFRTLASGSILYTNEPGFLELDNTLCFLNPRNYRQTKAQ